VRSVLTLTVRVVSRRSRRSGCRRDGARAACRGCSAVQTSWCRRGWSRTRNDPRRILLELNHQKASASSRRHSTGRTTGRPRLQLARRARAPAAVPDRAGVAVVARRAVRAGLPTHAPVAGSHVPGWRTGRCRCRCRPPDRADAAPAVAGVAVRAEVAVVARRAGRRWAADARAGRRIARAGGAALAAGAADYRIGADAAPLPSQCRSACRGCRRRRRTGGRRTADARAGRRIARAGGAAGAGAAARPDRRRRSSRCHRSVALRAGCRRRRRCRGDHSAGRRAAVAIAGCRRRTPRRRRACRCRRCRRRRRRLDEVGVVGDEVGGCSETTTVPSADALAARVEAPSASVPSGFMSTRMVLPVGDRAASRRRVVAVGGARFWRRW
jgi:hypothetical protein